MSFAPRLRPVRGSCRMHIVPLALLLALLSACSDHPPADPSAFESTAAVKKEIKSLRADINQKRERLAALEKRLVALGGKAQTEKKAAVELKTLELTTFRHFVEVQGQVESDRNVNVSAQAGGRIVNMLVEEGDAVKAGQTIAKIDAEVLRRQISQVEANLELARQNYERRKRLQDKEVGTEMAFLEAKSNKESLEAQLSGLKEQLALYTVTAPFAGHIDERYAKAGEMTGPGQPVVRLVSDAGYKVTVDLAASYSGKIKRGAPVELTAPDLGQTFQGRVKTIASQIHPVSRSFQVEITPVNPPKGLQPNLVVFAKINDYTAQEALVLPQAVVNRTDQGAYVYLAGNADGQLVANKQFIKLGKAYGERVEVLDGLSAGDRVIRKGYRNLSNGQPIREVDQPASGRARNQPPDSAANKPADTNARR